MMDVILESLIQVDYSGMKMPLVTVYNKPADYPGNLVGRVFDIDRATNAVVLYDTIEEARMDAAAAGFNIIMPRSVLDSEAIMEVYIR